MSEVKIKVEVSELHDAISKFQTCKDQLATAYGQMSTEVMALNNTWNGPASDAFVERFGELVANIRTSDATIEQAIAGLKEAADIYEEVEIAQESTWTGATEASPFNG